MEIVFVRHAEKEEIGEDPPITKKGTKQARYLAKKLRKKKFDEFYCSNMNRSKETAKIISKSIKKIPKIENSLNEFRVDILNKDKRKCDKKERDHYKNLISFLKKLTKDPNKNKSILMIAHGVTNRIILSYFLKLNLKRIVQFRQAEGGVNSIYWKEKFGNWRLNIWNDNTYLPKRIK